MNLNGRFDLIISNSRKAKLAAWVHLPSNVRFVELSCRWRPQGDMSLPAVYVSHLRSLYPTDLTMGMSTDNFRLPRCSTKNQRLGRADSAKAGKSTPRAVEG
jgi:hypothetical protein